MKLRGDFLGPPCSTDKTTLNFQFWTTVRSKYANWMCKSRGPFTPSFFVYIFTDNVNLCPWVNFEFKLSRVLALSNKSKCFVFLSKWIQSMQYLLSDSDYDPLISLSEIRCMFWMVISTLLAQNLFMYSLAIVYWFLMLHWWSIGCHPQLSSGLRSAPNTIRCRSFHLLHLKLAQLVHTS